MAASSRRNRSSSATPCSTVLSRASAISAALRAAPRCATRGATAVSEGTWRPLLRIHDRRHRGGARRDRTQLCGWCMSGGIAYGSTRPEPSSCNMAMVGLSRSRARKTSPSARSSRFETRRPGRCAHDMTRHDASGCTSSSAGTHYRIGARQRDPRRLEPVLPCSAR